MTEYDALPRISDLHDVVGLAVGRGHVAAEDGGAVGVEPGALQLVDLLTRLQDHGRVGPAMEKRNLFDSSSQMNH